MGIAIDEIIENVAVTREKRAGAYNMLNAHYHDHYEIYLLTKGNVRYFVDEKIYDLNEGDVVLIPPHVIHKTATLMNKGAERTLIAFTNEFIMYSQNDRIFSCFDLCYFKNPPIRELIEKTADEYFRKDRYSEDLVAGYIREMLVTLKRSTDEEKREESSEKDSIIENVVHYICENYGSDISLSHLAKEFALSESHFSRQFKAYTGFGVNEYISIVRIKNAEKLLKTTKLPVTEIAQSCGFNSSSYFAAVFKRIRGKSPVAVRKMQ